MVGQAFHHRRKVEIVEHRDFRHDTTHDDRVLFAAVENINAEARLPRPHGVGDVDGAFVVEDLPLLRRLGLRVEDLIDVFLHRVVGQLGHIQKPGPAVHADHGNTVGLQMDVRAVDLHTRLEEILQLELPFLDMNLRLRGVAVDISISRRCYSVGHGAVLYE